MKFSGTVDFPVGLLYDIRAKRIWRLSSQSPKQNMQTASTHFEKSVSYLAMMLFAKTRFGENLFGDMMDDTFYASFMGAFFIFIMKRGQEMEKKDLLEYLKMIIDTEETIYVLNSLIQRMEKKALTLGVPQKIIKPVEVQSWKHRYSPRPFMLIIATIVSLFITIISFNKLHNGFFAILIKLSLIALTCFLGLGVYATFKHEKSMFNIQQREVNIYEKALSDYNTKKTNDLKRCSLERLEKESILENINKLSQLGKDCKDIKAKLYNLQILHPKYQNYVAVCSIYDYLSTGTRNDLPGAYDKFDSEVLANRIISKLDAILQSLDEIKQNQYTLSETMRHAGQTVSILMNHQNNIMQYHAEKVDRNLNYLSRIEYIESKSLLRPPM